MRRVWAEAWRDALFAFVVIAMVLAAGVLCSLLRDPVRMHALHERDEARAQLNEYIALQRTLLLLHGVESTFSTVDSFPNPAGDSLP